MTTNKVTNTTNTKNKAVAVADELARVAAYAHMLGQLCELAPHAEPIPLEQLEIIFKDSMKREKLGSDTIKEILGLWCKICSYCSRHQSTKIAAKSLSFILGLSNSCHLIGIDILAVAISVIHHLTFYHKAQAFI